VSGRTIASASFTFGNSPQTLPNTNLSIEMKRGRLGRVRRSTLICWRNTRISTSSATRDRSRSITIPKISLHKSNIEQQHRPILDQPPADWIYDRHKYRNGTHVASRSGFLGVAPPLLPLIGGRTLAAAMRSCSEWQ
jgi:hypothetical protein